MSSLNRLFGPDRSRWYNIYRPLLGLIAVAQGDGLTETQLRRIRNAEVAEPLEVVQQYLDGQFPQGPFRPFHRSFTELLHDPSNVAYGIQPGPMHWLVADHYWNYQNSSAPWRRWDPYGIRYEPTHLAEAALASDPPEQDQAIDRLVGLMANPEFQQFHYSNVDDLSALQRDLERAVACAARDSRLEALPLVPQSALALGTFRREHLRPGPLFDLARRGEVQAAVRRLDLFEVDPDWYQASQLIIAWLAAGRPEAAALRDRLAADLRTTVPLPLLLARLDQRMGGGKASFEPLPPPQEPEVSRAIVDRMGGMGADMELLARRGLYRSIVSEGFTSRELVAMGGFLARDDAPHLVAYAAQPGPGEADPDQFLREYIALHASYNYPVYRNGSLLWVLAAVLRHPDDAWVERQLPVLAEAALAGGGADFKGAFPIGALTWRARIGQPSAIAELETRRQERLDQAARLICRRRAGYLGAGEPASGCTGRGAGTATRCAPVTPSSCSRQRFTYRTVSRDFDLRLASRSPNRSMSARWTWAKTDDAQQHALEAAHHIHDPSFLARSTARVNAMLQRWPLSVTTDAAIQRLIDEPSSAEFSALHTVLDVVSVAHGGGRLPAR